MRPVTTVGARPTTAPARPRLSLAELCHRVGEVPSPVISRILPEVGKDQVEVAAFNSSI